METNLCRSPFNEAKRWEYCLDHVPGGSGRVALKSWALRCTQDSIVPEAWTMKPVQLPHFCMQGTHTHTLSLLDVCQQPHRAGRERRGGGALCFWEHGLWITAEELGVSAFTGDVTTTGCSQSELWLTGARQGFFLFSRLCVIPFLVTQDRNNTVFM